MTFAAIGWGLVLFAAGLAAHVAWWRLARPVDEFRALALSFLAGPALGSLAVPGLAAWRETLGCAAAALLFGAMYIMLYPAAQAASPTMLLVLRIAAKGTAGETRAALGEALDADTLSRKSIDDMVHGRFADEVDGVLHIAPRGRFLLGFLTRWRRLLGLEYGSG